MTFTEHIKKFFTTKKEVQYMIIGVRLPNESINRLFSFENGSVNTLSKHFQQIADYLKSIGLEFDRFTTTKPYQERIDEYKVIRIGKDIGVENFDIDAVRACGKIHGIIANPVCTEFSTARSTGKARNPEEGMFLVRECQRIIEQAKPEWWVIENPAKGVLKKYLGKPTYEYEPWWYGSPWTKRTALWGKFNIPERTYYKWEDVPKLEGLYQRPGRGKPSLAFMHKSHYHKIPEFQCLPEPQSDMEFRSLCSQKFAQAFFKANP